MHQTSSPPSMTAITPSYPLFSTAIIPSHLSFLSSYLSSPSFSFSFFSPQPLPCLHNLLVAYDHLDHRELGIEEEGERKEEKG